MAKAKKFTQNINKDAGLMDLPKVTPHKSTWETKHSNYITSNIGDIVPVYLEEIVPGQKKKSLNMAMLSHMTQPYAPIFNAQYTEFRSFWVPYRLCADLLNGYKTRKSPWVKVFGEDPANTSAKIIVPLAEQKLPSPNIDDDVVDQIIKPNLNDFGGIFDALDYEVDSASLDGAWVKDLNFLDMAAYELIYQRHYRNQNRESATNSTLYKFLYNLYASQPADYDDSFHKASREKDYFTGSQPFTQKGDPVSAGLVGDAPVYASVKTISANQTGSSIDIADITTSLDSDRTGATNYVEVGDKLGVNFSNSDRGLTTNNLVADLSAAGGINIEQLRLMIKLQEELEKDAMYGTFYSQYLNSRFGCSPISTELEEPLELKKVIITSQMQPIFQTSSTANEETILGNIGANATTQSGLFEIIPHTEFKEHGVLMICAVHKAQNAYDSLCYKPKRIFKKSRFDFYTPSLNDLGFQPIQRKEFDPIDFTDDYEEAVSYNEAWSEYRFKFNKIHGMFEQSRSGALNYWTLGISRVADVESLYKQDVTELNRAINVSSDVAPQFFDAYGFIEVDTKPMSLHSIPGMDGVI